MQTMLRIPSADPKAGYLAHREEIDAAVRRVLTSGWYILGDETRAFEAAFAGYVGVREGVGVASGTDAVHLALRACGVGPGDEVVTVSHTATATVAAVDLCGATPVLVDIDPTSYTMIAQHLAAALTPRTRAVVPVHLYGHPADMTAILAVTNGHGICVVEDCAQAHGAAWAGRKVGGWGTFGAFSFYPTKNLGALGDGGMVATDDADLGAKARMLREYGWKQRYVSEFPGMNSRLDELQAAILGVKLRYLDQENDARRGLARVYEEGLSGLDLALPSEAPGARHVFHQFVVRAPHRDRLRDFLAARGVGTSVLYPTPNHLQPGYAGCRIGPEGLAETERASAEILCLPVYPELSVDHAERVVAVIRAFEGR